MNEFTDQESNPTENLSLLLCIYKQRGQGLF